MSVQLTHSANPAAQKQPHIECASEKSWWEESFDDLPHPNKIQTAFVQQQIQGILRQPSQANVANLLKQDVPQDPFDQFDPEAFKSKLLSNYQKN